jgi:uncharacterized protein YbjT (DUF2867 family)
MDQVYVCYHPDLAFPGADLAIEAFTRLAVASGVQRIVLLSGRNEPAAQDCEQIVQRSGAAWTIIRSSFFAQNFSEGIFTPEIQAGTLHFVAGDVPEPFIDIEDIAEIAVAALSSDRHDGKLYEVTGSQLVSFADAMATVGRLTGREIRYQQVPSDAYRQAMVDAGVPAAAAEAYVKLFDMITDGRGNYLTDGVEQALGRPARSFDDYAEAAAATGVWGAA